jgi:hypothetical protein
MSHRAITPSAAIQPTRVTFSGNLRQLGEAKLVVPNFKTSTNETPQNAQFRIAVDQYGAVRYCFIWNSSGDVALDEEARQHLALCRFPMRTSGDSLVWGIATIEWGNDVASANAKPTPNAP